MRGVIYARYSSDNQREESIEGQIRENTAYANKNGIDIVGTYIDRAYSAKTDNRPEFHRIDGLVKAIFVYNDYIKLILTFDDKPINIPTTEEIEYMANSSDIQSNVSPPKSTAKAVLFLFFTIGFHKCSYIQFFLT